MALCQVVSPARKAEAVTQVIPPAATFIYPFYFYNKQTNYKTYNIQQPGQHISYQNNNIKEMLHVFTYVLRGNKTVTNKKKCFSESAFLRGVRSSLQESFRYRQLAWPAACSYESQSALYLDRCTLVFGNIRHYCWSPSRHIPGDTVVTL